MKRISQLDGVRGIAILLVLVWHYFCCQVDPASIGWFVRLVLGLTWSGVDLFFVLSGFLIVGILLDFQSSANYFRVFYVRRVCRIFPLYFIVLGIYVYFVLVGFPEISSSYWLFRNPMPLWSYGTFTQNFFMGDRGGYGPNWLGDTWSLAVEEQFYLVIPLLVYFLPRRVLLCVLAFGIATGPFLRYRFPGFQVLVSTPWRADALFFGAVLAILVRRPDFIAAARRRQNFLWMLFGLFFLGVFLLSFQPIMFRTFMYSWLAVLYSIVVLIGFTENENLMGRFLGSPVLVWFGQLSYGIYLFHQPVNGILHGLFGQDSPRMNTLSDAGITVAALCVTLVTATLSYRFFENPFLKLGHRFKYAPKSRSASATAPAEAE